MKYQIKLYPSNVGYFSSSEKTLLESAIDQNYVLAHGCKNGSCHTCVADLISGTIKNQQGELVSSGKILTCCSYAQNNLVIGAEYYEELSSISCVNLPCKVSDWSLITRDILILKLRFPPKTVFNYLPGQYIDLTYQGITRSYSIANAFLTNDEIELHIRLIKSGNFSKLLSTEQCVNKLMRLEGPKGIFFVRKLNKPIIFIAGGTGFAPIKAMIEGLIKDTFNYNIYIYWGVNNSKDFYSDLPFDWQTKNHLIKYCPVVSGYDSCWTGRRGLLHESVLEDFTELSNYVVYACGSKAMIDSAKESLLSYGLSSDYFYCDVFVSSSQKEV